MYARRIDDRRIGKLSLLLVLVMTASGAAPRVINLGTSADVSGVAVLVDGTAVLAGGNTATNRPMLWSISSTSTVTTTLLTGPGGEPRTGIANGISADGTYIAGSLYKVGAPLPFQTDGAVWTRTQPTAPTIVPDLPDFFPSTVLRSVSNSKIAVGSSAQNAYRWSPLLGGLPLLTIDSSGAWANAINAAGTITVGTALDDVSEYAIAVTWSAGQYTPLDSDYSTANGISPNGQYIVGASDVVDDPLLELDAVYWDNGQQQMLLDPGTGLPLTGQASWATDAGIIGGFAGPPGGAPVDGWLYFQGMQRAISFDTWWKQITGTTFPVDVTSIPAAAERNGDLYLILNGGAYFATVLWAAPADANRDRVVEGADYTIWADNYLNPSATTFEQGDFNGVHDVNGADYTIWADNYNPLQLAFTTATPEPSTASLMLVGSALGLLIAASRWGLDCVRGRDATSKPRIG